MEEEIMVETRVFASKPGLRLVFSSWLLAWCGLLSVFLPSPGNTLLAAESDSSLPDSSLAYGQFQRKIEASDLDVLLRGAAERDAGEIAARLKRVCPEALGEVKDIFHGVELCGHFPLPAGKDESEGDRAEARQATVKRYLKFFDRDLNRIRHDPPVARKRVRRESDIIALDLVLKRLYGKVCTRYRNYRGLSVLSVAEPDVSERKRLRRELIGLCGLPAVEAVDAVQADSTKSFRRWLFRLNLDTLWRGALKTDPELVQLDNYWKSVPPGCWNLMAEISPERSFPRSLYEVRFFARMPGGVDHPLPGGWTGAPGYPVPTASSLAAPVFSRSRVGTELLQFTTLDNSILSGAKAAGCDLNPNELILMCGLVQRRSQRISKAFSEFMEQESGAHGNRSHSRDFLKEKLESLCGADALLEVERNLGY